MAVTTPTEASRHGAPTPATYVLLSLRRAERTTVESSKVFVPLWKDIDDEWTCSDVLPTDEHGQTVLSNRLR